MGVRYIEVLLISTVHSKVQVYPAKIFFRKIQNNFNLYEFIHFFKILIQRLRGIAYTLSCQSTNGWGVSIFSIFLFLISKFTSRCHFFNRSSEKCNNGIRTGYLNLNLVFNSYAIHCATSTKDIICIRCMLVVGGIHLYHYKKVIIFIAIM